MPQTATDVVIIGGSTAALRAAETVTRQAPELDVTIISEEAHLPYELPPLSKIPLKDHVDIESLVYPVARELREMGVHSRLGERATAIDPARRVVTTDTGQVRYRAAIITTGCEPIVPPMFRGQQDVYVLRRFDDSVALRQAVEDRQRSVAIVGAGFIGGEFASTLISDGRKVSLIDLSVHPLIRFGEEVSGVYEELHRYKGDATFFGVGATGTIERDGSRFLQLSDGREVAADVIVVGVGVRPAVSWLGSSGIPLDNGIVADEYLHTVEGVFAAGDAVCWPNARFNATMRIEHWTTAAEQGRGAGLNAVKYLKDEPLVPFVNVPFFGSDQHGQRIQWAGHQLGGEQVVFNRNEGGELFLFRKGDLVTGVLAFERRQEFVQLRAKLRQPLAWDVALGIASGFESTAREVPVP